MTPRYPDEYDPDSYQAGVEMGWRLAFEYFGFDASQDQDEEYPGIFGEGLTAGDPAGRLVP